MAGFSGAWLSRSQVNQPAPLAPPIDPQHLRPEPDPNLFPNQSPDWVNNAPAPDVPWTGDASVPQVQATGVGPVDHVQYSTLNGVGFGHGLTEEEARAIAAAANNADDGSYAARMYEANVQRDGTYHAAVVPDSPDQGDSPETTMIQRSGVGTPLDPFARLASRLERGYTGFIDQHMYDVDFRPLRPEYARPVPMQSTPGHSQLSPSTPSVIGYEPAPQDRFVQQIVRRAPGDWAEPFSTDGTAYTMVGAVNAYGLPSWGL